MSDNIDIKRDGNLTYITLTGIAFTPEDEKTLKEEVALIVSDIKRAQEFRAQMQITINRITTRNPARPGCGGD